MTHIDNVSHILEHGVTHKNSIHADNAYTAIGDSSLINTRNSYVVPNDKKLGDYIPFYFGFRTPMLYVIQNGFNGVHVVLPENIVYLVSNLDLILKSDISFLYTDGHATDRFSKFYSRNDVSGIMEQIDFDAAKAVFWQKEDDLDYKRKKEAEFLLEKDLPFEYLVGLVVYNVDAEKRLIEKGVSLPIAIKPNYYF